MTFIAWLLLMLLVGELVLIANEVRKRQRIQRDRDAAMLEAFKQQSEQQVLSMRQMCRMNELSMERFRRENSEKREGESWKEGG